MTNNDVEKFVKTNTVEKPARQQDSHDVSEKIKVAEDHPRQVKVDGEHNIGQINVGGNVTINNQIDTSDDRIPHPPPAPEPAPRIVSEPESAPESKSIKPKGDDNVIVSGDVGGDVKIHYHNQNQTEHSLESLLDYLSHKRKQKSDPAESTLNFIRRNIHEKQRTDERRKRDRREEHDLLADGERILDEELKRHHLEEKINDDLKHDFAAVAGWAALNAWRHQYRAQLKMVESSARLFAKMLEDED